MFSLALCFAGLDADPRTAIENALFDATPPPSLRAAFRASISSENGYRRIEFDPMRDAQNRFRILSSVGNDEELDNIVSDWAREQQPDVRLFADDLRDSVGQGEIHSSGSDWMLNFQYKLSGNDGAIDKMVSGNMFGQLVVDAADQKLLTLDYSISKPIEAGRGAKVTSYDQRYYFGHSERWGVTFVKGLDLHAAGGRFGFKVSRAFSVRVSDVSFTLATDVKLEEQSKAYAKTVPGNLKMAFGDAQY